MEPIAIKGANRNLHPPRGWDEQRDGPCGVLPVIAAITDGSMKLYSAWQLDDEERAAIAAGHPVVLIIHGHSMPACALGVAAESYDLAVEYKPAAECRHRSCTSDGLITTCDVCGARV